MTAGKFGIRGVPTMMLFKDGKLSRHQGRRDEPLQNRRVAERKRGQIGSQNEPAHSSPEANVGEVPAKPGVRASPKRIRIHESPRTRPRRLGASRRSTSPASPGQTSLSNSFPV